jgi:hypothetical protein
LVQQALDPIQSAGFGSLARQRWSSFKFLFLLITQCQFVLGIRILFRQANC